MIPDNKQDELLAKIEALQQDVKECQAAISLLKKQLGNLRTSPVNIAPQKNNSFTLENFVGLKLIHIVGIIVLITGLSIGVKYAIDVNLISPHIRIVLAYIAGIILFLVSLKLRKKYELFSIILFSGAVASAYFTTYAGFTYYAMFPRIPAFGIMLLLMVFAVYTALKYNRPEIAMLGLVGAYGIPFFVRGNSENITGLFSYVLFINLGILFLSLKKYWLSLNYLSFFTTWAIYFTCLFLDVNNKHAFSAFIFAMAFYILFMLSSLGFKMYRRYNIRYADSIIIIMNTLFLYTALALLMYKNDYERDGKLALVFAIVYFLAALLFRKMAAAQQILSNALFSISIVALITYFALGYDGFFVTISWVIMAVVLFVAGMQYRIKLFRFAAMFLFAFTIVKLLFFDSNDFTSIQKVIAYIFTGVVLLLVSFLYQRFSKHIFEQEQQDPV